VEKRGREERKWVRPLGLRKMGELRAMDEQKRYIYICYSKQHRFE
jgi:hypothetical protein